ncbi:MAG: T9SS type A sorting domain-containing protein [bacterium]|nr:T9SS type A sorting domain-containing protein [bacterium]
MKNFKVFLFCIICSTNLNAQNDKTYIKFYKTSIQNEFLVRIFFFVPDSFIVDLHSTTLSLVNNREDSIDLAEYKVIKFVNESNPLLGIFNLDEFDVGKFVKLHFVFKNKYNTTNYTRTEYYALVLDEGFKIFYENNNSNSIIMYFNDNLYRDIMLFNSLGQNIKKFTSVHSGSTITVNHLAKGVYYLYHKDFISKKIFLK